jgi:hypothetical protein
MHDDGCVGPKHVDITNKKECMIYSGVAVTMHPVKLLLKLH